MKIHYKKLIPEQLNQKRVSKLEDKTGGNHYCETIKKKNEKK